MIPNSMVGSNFVNLAWPKFSQVKQSMEFAKRALYNITHSAY